MTARRLKIAILGATSHIAKGLIYYLSRNEAYALQLYARSPEKVKQFLDRIQSPHAFVIDTLEGMKKQEYDAIINCIGMGTPEKVKSAGIELFRVTEEFDNLTLECLENSKECIYINMSSGAVYGKEFASPANDESLFMLHVNQMEDQDNYAIAKINSEAKHRALKNRHIVDVRVFGYFSRYIDIEARYLLTEILRCVRNGTEFKTKRNDIVRDYIHPSDLAQLIEKCIAKKDINGAIDATSKKPVTKYEILDYFKKEYGLRCAITDDIETVTATGGKACYYSLRNTASSLGYEPYYTSMDCIAAESKHILKET